MENKKACQTNYGGYIQEEVYFLRVFTLMERDRRVTRDRWYAP
jgi:hypothetical protein